MIPPTPIPLSGHGAEGSILQAVSIHLLVDGPEMSTQPDQKTPSLARHPVMPIQPDHSIPISDVFQVITIKPATIIDMPIDANIPESYLSESLPEKLAIRAMKIGCVTR